jgi:hypothetical protein
VHTLLYLYIRFVPKVRVLIFGIPLGAHFVIPLYMVCPKSKSTDFFYEQIVNVAPR